MRSFTLIRLRCLVLMPTSINANTAARGMCKMEVRDIIIPPVLAFGQEERMVFGTKLEENQWIVSDRAKIAVAFRLTRF